MQWGVFGEGQAMESAKLGPKRSGQTWRSVLLLSAELQGIPLETTSPENQATSCLRLLKMKTNSLNTSPVCF